MLSVNKYGQKHLIDDIPEYGFALCITSQFYHVRWQQVPKGFREGSLSSSSTKSLAYQLKLMPNQSIHDRMVLLRLYLSHDHIRLSSRAHFSLPS